MCGILFSLSKNSDNGHETLILDETLLSRVSSRGPDSLQTITRSSHNHVLSFTSSVLHLRGTSVVSQPVQDQSGNILCWNGEAWSGLPISEEDNDTVPLSRLLKESPQDVLTTFASIRGPYAFVYFQAKEAKIWYSRDVLGRRSLLKHDTPDGFMLCSVGHRDQGNWEELATDGIYCHDLCSCSTTSYQWHSESSNDNGLRQSYSPVNQSLPPIDIDTKDRSQELYSSQVTRFQEHLTEAIRVRTNTIPAHITGPHASDSRVAVMYSGGVDCAVLARLLNDTLRPSEPIDLLNVSFENPRTVSNARKLDPEFDRVYDTPDRVTGIQGYHELRRICPDRPWRFIRIDVTYAESQRVKNEVLDLMFPNDSIMDYSIALAFYFCAKGQGIDHASSLPYETKAKVYFSGLGADEQLGGYSRHLAAYRRNGYPALIAELQMDLSRIPSRNLGRDDRILSNFGREVRWPFLDESVISFLSDLRVDQKMSFECEGGDKIILRDLARRLEIPLAAAEKKRAIQFGSRSARMEVESGKTDRVRGHDRQK